MERAAALAAAAALGLVVACRQGNRPSQPAVGGGSHTPSAPEAAAADAGAEAAAAAESSELEQERAEAAVAAAEEQGEQEARRLDVAVVKAAGEGDEAGLLGLLGEGGDPDADNTHGWSALHAAASRGHKACVAALLEAGALVDAQDGGGSTPLITAARNGHCEVVGRLLEGGADVAQASEVAPASANPVRAPHACCGPAPEAEAVPPCRPAARPLHMRAQGRRPCALRLGPRNP